MSRRICFIRQSHYPEELSTRREVETLHQAGYEMHIICLASQSDSEKPRRSEEVVNGVFVHHLPLRRVKASIYRYLYDYLSFFLLAAIKVTAMHLKRPFAAIQVNTMPDFLVFATLIPKILGTKVTVWMREPVPELWATVHDGAAPGILAWVEQMALRYVDTAFAVTQQLKDTYVARGADPDKIHAIPNVPEERFLEVQGISHGKSDDGGDFTLICHGAIEERYGHDTMLEAVALVRSEIPNLRLRILGKGSHLDEFLAQRKQLGLEDCVDYLGYVSLERMIQELYAADVGIVAQKSSPYSNLVHTNKMYEFIAIGKPVLASRLKSVEAYFDEDALRYFEPGDPESLAEGILDLYQHPAKRQALVENACKLYNEYKWEKQREIYLSIYRELIDEPE